MRAWLLSYMSALGWNATGLIMTAAGLLLIIRFGMPFRLSAVRDNSIITEDSFNSAWIEPTYKAPGYIGLIVILTGIACQIAGAYLS